MISIKNSCSNLKKTNTSTNNSTEITIGNVSGSIKTGIKATETSSRNMSGSMKNKLDITSRQSKDNVLNVS